MVLLNDGNERISPTDGIRGWRGGREPAAHYPSRLSNRPAITPPSCTIKLFCLGALLIFLGSILLCTLGFTVLLPFVATRDWPEVACNVTNATFNPNYCACNQISNAIEKETNVLDRTTNTLIFDQLEEYEPCISEYPCLQIRVVYEALFITNRTTSTSNGTLMTSQRDDVTSDARREPAYAPVLVHGMLYRFWNDAFHEKCTLYECGDDVWNRKEALRYRDAWGQVGSTHRCYVNPESPRSLVISRMPRSAAIHAMFWPTICLGTGIIIWLGLCAGFGKYDITKDPNASYGLL